jgi:hypothetical protein
VLEPMNDCEPNRPREPELPVVDALADPGEREMPPLPDPPEVAGVGYGSEERYYRPEGWEPASSHPPAARVERAAARR